MATNKTGSKLSTSTWLGIKRPKSSMSDKYTLEFEHMESPHEESWWDPGKVLDSRGSVGEMKSAKANRQKGTQKAATEEVTDSH